MPRQTTDTLLMVAPDHFQYNPETALTNAFQTKLTQQDVRKTARSEFNNMVATLRAEHIRVLTLPSTGNFTPDAVFPNNWFSTHLNQEDKTVLVIYPMLTPNRRAERQIDQLVTTLTAQGIEVSEIIDLSHYEALNLALEGTGSLVLDRTNRFAYAALSPRTNQHVLADYIRQLAFQPICFHSADEQGQPIYHTNVLMSVGRKFAVVCLETIHDVIEKTLLINSLEKGGRRIIPITIAQMKEMAANILEVQDTQGKSKIILSQTAFHAFSFSEREQLGQFGKLVPVAIDTIEKVGGGSARCMLAEIFYSEMMSS